jgi:putative FmdB family regulatory protein
MPCYPYRCSGPEVHHFDVIKPVADIDRYEHCPVCNNSNTERLIALVSIDKEAAGGWNQQSFNPALGQWTRSTAEARKIAKSRGMEEIGTEPVENIHKKFDKDRADKYKARWDDDRDLKYN